VAQVVAAKAAPVVVAKALAEAIVRVGADKAMLAVGRAELESHRVVVAAMHNPSSAPNNSFKPTPLRGSA
jgi:hypothetical protein